MKDNRKQIRRTQYAISIAAIILVIVHLIWPSINIDSITLFLLAIAVIPWLITIFKSLELPGGWKIEFQEYEALDTKAKDLAEKAKEEAPKVAINWDKVATLFWFGNDLMWIQDMTYRVAPPERVLEGIAIVMEYAKELGFEEKSYPIRNLILSKTILESLVGLSMANEQARQLLDGHYRTVRQYVQQTKWYVDALAKEKQPGFEKGRSLASNPN